MVEKVDTNVCDKLMLLRLSGSDAHLFFRRLEAQATEYVIEVKATLLHNLTSTSSNINSAPGGSAKTPSFCVDFVQLLLNLFNCLSQSAQHISEFIRHLVSATIFEQLRIFLSKVIFRCFASPSLGLETLEDTVVYHNTQELQPFGNVSYYNGAPPPSTSCTPSYRARAIT